MLLAADTMTTKITLTVALAAGLLLLSVSDVGANPVADKSSDIPPSGIEGPIPLEEPEPMSEEDMLQLLVDCAVARLRGAHLSDHQVYQIKTALSHVSEAEANHLAAEEAAKPPEQLAQQILSFLLEQCVMEDMGVEMGPHAHV